MKHENVHPIFQGILNAIAPHVPEVDFHCHKCGADTDIAPNPPAKAVCENCCEDHDYRYERGQMGHFCIHCGKPAPADWYED